MLDAWNDIVSVFTLETVRNGTVEAGREVVANSGFGAGTVIAGTAAVAAVAGGTAWYKGWLPSFGFGKKAEAAPAKAEAAPAFVAPTEAQVKDVLKTERVKAQWDKLSTQDKALRVAGMANEGYFNELKARDEYRQLRFVDIDEAARLMPAEHAAYEAKKQAAKKPK